jgi:hypothetical protein
VLFAVAFFVRKVRTAWIRSMSSFDGTTTGSLCICMDLTMLLSSCLPWREQLSVSASARLSVVGFARGAVWSR